MTELSEEQLKAIETVQELMRLGNSNPNEAESASAIAKAQAYLAKYNLDMAMVGEHSAGDAKREEATLKGGAYKYQRWPWENVAELNFCMYWCERKYVHYKVRAKMADGTPFMRDWPRYQWHHFFVGRVVNTAATRVMAEYLESAVERILRERLANEVTGFVPSTQLFTKWSVSYRTGAMDRIVEKIQERRNELKEEENRKRAEAERNGSSTSNALTISTYSSAEEDANNDFIHGEGWSAQQAAERAQRAADRAAAEAEYTRWAAAHPEEARKAEEERRIEREEYWKRRRGGRRQTSFKDNLDRSAYFAGHDAAKVISIEPQDGSGSQKRIA